MPEKTISIMVTQGTQFLLTPRTPYDRYNPFPARVYAVTAYLNTDDVPAAFFKNQ